MVKNLEGVVALTEGRPDDALQLFTSALSGEPVAHGAASAELDITVHLVLTYERLGRLPEGQALIERVLGTTAPKKLDPARSAVLMQALARVKSAQGSFIDAEEWYEKAERSAVSAFPKAKVLADLSRTQRSLSPERAHATLERAVALLEGAPGVRALRAGLLLQQASLEEEAGRHNRADALLSEAIAALVDVYGRHAYETLQAQLVEIDILLQRRDHRRALETLDRLAPAFERDSLVRTPLRASYEHDRAAALFYRGAEAEMSRVIEHAVRARELMPDQLARAETFLFTAQARRRLGDRQGAIADLKEAISLGTRVVPTGHEAGRAQYLSKWSQMYSQLVAWHVEDGDANEAFSSQGTLSRTCAPRTTACTDDTRARSLLGDVGTQRRNLRQIVQRTLHLVGRDASRSPRHTAPRTSARRDPFE